MTQWYTDNRILIVHGSSEIDDQHSFISVVRVPTIGCASCRQLQENEPNDHLFRRIDLCIKCNLTIHTKYRYNESIQKFQPKIHLKIPDYIIMCENSLIHTINVQLDMQKTKKSGSNALNYKYLSTKCEIGRDHNNMVTTMKSQPVDGDMKHISIVEQILADFSEYDVIDCSSPAPSQETHHGCEKYEMQGVKTRLEIMTRPTVEPTCSQPKPSSPQSSELLEAAAKTYEFSEENEKCEKISIFRKRRLADKKYEFNEERENIIPFYRTRNRTRNTSINQSRMSPHPSFRSPVANRSIISPHGIRSPNNYSAFRSSPSHNLMYSPPARQHMRLSGSNSPAGIDDVHKYFSDIMNRLKDSRVESDNESNHEDLKGTEFPTFSKKIINYYVEEDDANSVVTCEEDDCISPGYHLSLPMEVHGSCYSKMQLVAKASLNRLKGVPRAIVTQNSFDIETFSIYIANKLCSKNNKKYGILFDLAFEIIHVSSTFSSIDAF